MREAVGCPWRRALRTQPAGSPASAGSRGTRPAWSRSPGCRRTPWSHWRRRTRPRRSRGDLGQRSARPRGSSRSRRRPRRSLDQGGVAVLRVRRALDEDAPGRPGRARLAQDPRRPARLAGLCVRVRELLGADEAAQHEGDRHEGQPAEDRDLAVAGAPAPHPGGEVVRSADSVHGSSLARFRTSRLYASFG